MIFTLLDLVRQNLNCIIITTLLLRQLSVFLEKTEQLQICVRKKVVVSLFMLKLCDSREKVGVLNYMHLVLEVFLKMSKSFLVGIIYRYPNETTKWNEKFEIFIDKVLETQKEVKLKCC